MSQPQKGNSIAFRLTPTNDMWDKQTGNEEEISFPKTIFYQFNHKILYLSMWGEEQTSFDSSRTVHGDACTQIYSIFVFVRLNGKVFIVKLT